MAAMRSGPKIWLAGNCPLTSVPLRTSATLGMTQWAWMSTTFTRLPATITTLRPPCAWAARAVAKRNPSATYPALAAAAATPKRKLRRLALLVSMVLLPRASTRPPPFGGGTRASLSSLSRRYRGRQRQIIADDFAALHDEFHPLKFGDVLERVAGNGSEIGEFALLDRTDAVLPAQRLGVDDGSALERPCRCEAAGFHQFFEVERLRTMDIGRAIGATAHHDLHARGLGSQLNGFGENGGHLVLAARRLVVVIVHIGLSVALQRRVIEQALGDHHVGLFLIQAEGVLDGVAAGDDGILLPLAAINMARGLLAEPMGLIDQRLQDRYGIGQDVFRLAI